MRSKNQAGRRMGVLTVALALSAGVAAAACSLTDTKHDPCTRDDQCATAFGAGSRCSGGYCTDPGGPGGDGGCTGVGADGTPCVCNPATPVQIENACTTVGCVPFDDTKRVTKLLPDGGLPPLP